jgi:hypothetical protein
VGFYVTFSFSWFIGFLESFVSFLVYYLFLLVLFSRHYLFACFFFLSLSTCFILCGIICCMLGRGEK